MRPTAAEPPPPPPERGILNWSDADMATAINMHHIHSTFCIRSPYSVQNGPRLCQRSLHCFKSCRSTKRPAHKLSASKHCYNPEARASAKTGKTSTQPLSPLGCRSRVQAVSNSDAQLKAAAALLVGLGLCMPDAAQAFNMHQEPDNALSFPTWVIHISSVIEWIVAMGLVWRYAEVTGANV